MSLKEELKELNVIVLDQVDKNLSAEEMATLSAMCSRSHHGPLANIERVMKRGASSFMEQVYVGYGHRSVGKMAHTNIFVSGLSMLAINDIQNINPLYKGQESSTRYIPFEDTGYVLPVSLQDDTRYAELADDFMNLYVDSTAYLMEKFVSVFGVDLDDPKAYNALKAYVFDRTRGFLPAGCKTVGVWNGDVENIDDTLRRTVLSSRIETSYVSEKILGGLHARYPSTFPQPMYDYSSLKSDREIIADGITGYLLGDAKLVNTDNIDMDVIRMMSTYTENTNYWPHSVGALGTVGCNFHIDFASYRDINRHRKSVIVRGNMYEEIEMHDFYLNELSLELKERYYKLEDRLRTLVDNHKDNVIREDDLEYICPMGLKVKVHASFPYDNFLYVCALRSKETVHPTVREVILDIAARFEVDTGISVRHNSDRIIPFSYARGNDTISVKGE